jgi:hypothetical protein
MDIELPNGTVIQGIPEGTSKQDIMAKAIKAGLATAADFGMSQEPVRGRPTMANDPRLIKDTESRPSNEGMFDKVGRFLSTPAPLITPEQLGGSTFGRTVQGVLDPLLGIGQLASKVVGNDEVSQRLQQNELRYQQARQQAGEEGTDIARIVGNVASPVNYIAPAAVTGGLMRSAATGATLAATNPVYGTDFWSDKGTQVAVGAVLGPLAEYGVKGAGKLLDSFKGLSESGRMQALQDWLLKTSGKDKEVIIKALQEVQPVVAGSRPTAMEALAAIPEGAPLAAAQQAISRKPSAAPVALARQSEQEAARQAELAAIAGTPEQRAALAVERQAVTTPLREDALAQANVYGQVVPQLQQEVAAREAATIANLQGAGKAATEEAQATVRANTWSPVPGYPRFPGRYSPNYERAKEYVGAIQDFANAAGQRRAEMDFKKLQLQSVADEGFYPLSTSPLINKIDDSLSRVGERSNELLTSSLQSMRGKLERFTDQNGIINSIDLYNIRKEIADDIKANLVAKQGTNASFTTQAANVEQTLKKYLDDAINKASGSTLWSDYLSKYSIYSQKLNRMEIGAELEKKLGTPLDNKERAAAFAQAVQDAGSLIKRATGQARFEKVSQVLTPEETGAVNRVLADLTRLEKGKTLASGANAPEYAPKAPLEGTSLLSRAYTVAKEVMQALSRGNKEEFERKFIDLAMNPQAMAAFMQSGPITTQRKLIEAMNKRLSPEGQRILIQSATVGEPARIAGE